MSKAEMIIEMLERGGFLIDKPDVEMLAEFVEEILNRE